MTGPEVPADGGDSSDDADAYDAAHDPAEDIAELGLGEEAILGGAQPPDAGQEYIDLTNPNRNTKESRER